VHDAGQADSAVREKKQQKQNEKTMELEGILSSKFYS